MARVICIYTWPWLSKQVSPKPHKETTPGVIFLKPHPHENWSWKETSLAASQGCFFQRIPGLQNPSTSFVLRILGCKSITCHINDQLWLTEFTEFLGQWPSFLGHHGALGLCVPSLSDRPLRRWCRSRTCVASPLEARTPTPPALLLDMPLRSNVDSAGTAGTSDFPTTWRPKAQESVLQSNLRSCWIWAFLVHRCCSSWRPVEKKESREGIKLAKNPSTPCGCGSSISLFVGCSTFLVQSPFDCRSLWSSKPSHSPWRSLLTPKYCWGLYDPPIVWKLGHYKHSLQTHRF